MRTAPFWWILMILMLLVDFYFYQGLLTVLSGAGPFLSVLIPVLYWLISALAIFVLIILPRLSFGRQQHLAHSPFFSVITGLFFAKLTGTLFFLADDIRRGVHWIAGTMIMPSGEPVEAARSLVLSWVGLAAGGGLFGTLLYGFRNKYQYQVKNISLKFDKLPPSFKGLRMVHISDIHSGSFTNKDAVTTGVIKIMEQKPDLILFTGDLVNHVADEMNDYLDLFSRIQAPMGVYSVLGNHDYGDYVKWKSADDKAANLEKLKLVHARMGWKLLMNEHVILEKEEDKIAVLGIENWSAKARFPKYGDLKKANACTEGIDFKILLSHDPSHWKSEVLPSTPDISLMLSGHTHGMQFGVEIPGLKWSPVQYAYKEWAGLYQHSTVSATQYLYVNRGFGFHGYPGRVGIMPEITVLELV